MGGGEEGEEIRAGARGLSEDTSFSQGATRGCRGRESRRRCRRNWHRRRREKLRGCESSQVRSSSLQSRSRFATCLGSDEGREDTMRLEDPRATSRKSSHGMGHHESDAHLAWNAGAKVGKKGPKEEATVAKGPTGAAGGWNRSGAAMTAAMAAGVVEKGDGEARHAEFADAATNNDFNENRAAENLQAGLADGQGLVRQGRIGQSRGGPRHTACGGGAPCIARWPCGAWWRRYSISVYYLQCFLVDCYCWLWKTTMQCRISAAGWLYTGVWQCGVSSQAVQVFVREIGVLCLQ